MNRIFNRNRTEHAHNRVEQRNNREVKDKPRPLAAALARLALSLDNIQKHVLDTGPILTTDELLISQNMSSSPVSASLRLSGRQLQRLPEPLPDNLTAIFADNNQLQTLPNRLSQNLLHLYLSGNQLQTLPYQMPNKLCYLDVSYNSLHTLPDNLPQTLATLIVNFNRLTTLPKQLPKNLSYLQAIGNQLQTLPDELPEYLYSLRLSGNQLQTLPEKLPKNLAFLHVQRNQLTKLPQPLPKNLKELLINENQLRELSNETWEQIENGMTCLLYHNPLSKKTVERFFELARTDSDAYVTGCMIIKSDIRAGKAGFPDEPVVPAIPEAKAYLPAKNTPQRFENTRARSPSPIPVKLKPAPTVDVSAKHYDKYLDELIKKARGSFHLEQLKKIAREQTNETGNQNDLLLSYYQTKLSGQLALHSETSSAADSVNSLFTKKNLDYVKAKLLQADQKEFIDYLSTNFTEWQEAIHTKAPELYEQADKQLIEATNKKLSRRVNKKLKDLPTPMRSEAEKTIQEQVRTELKQEVYEKLTRDFLASKGMLHLLD